MPDLQLVRSLRAPAPQRIREGLVPRRHLDGKETSGFFASREQRLRFEATASRSFLLEVNRVRLLFPLWWVKPRQTMHSSFVNAAVRI